MRHRRVRATYTGCTSVDAAQLKGRRSASANQRQRDECRAPYSANSV
jgi:hypothetical protein